MQARLAIGIDCGATKISAAVVADPAETVELLSEPTPQGSAEEIVEQIGGLIERLVGSANLDLPVPVGVGLPAQIDFRRQRVIEATNLPLDGIDVVGILSRRFHAKVIVDNDANLAALAEQRYGAAVGITDAVCLTMGTGIGGGLIINGEIYRGWLGVGAEVGHIVLGPGPECRCGGTGCFEALAAGPALERKARAAVVEHPESLLAELSGGDSGSITGTTITKAAKEGDELSIRLLADVGEILGQALVSLANLLNPQVFVIGGGMIEAGDLILDPARRVVRECAMRPVQIGLEIVQAKFGNQAGYLGAAILARERFG